MSDSNWSNICRFDATLEAARIAVIKMKTIYLCSSVLGFALIHSSPFLGARNSVSG
jgi:hypothetical protein